MKTISVFDPFSVDGGWKRNKKYIVHEISVISQFANGNCKHKTSETISDSAECNV